mgnify:CR=1 FL=1
MYSILPSVYQALPSHLLTAEQVKSLHIEYKKSEHEGTFNNDYENDDFRLGAFIIEDTQLMYRQNSLLQQCRNPSVIKYV